MPRNFSELKSGGGGGGGGGANSYAVPHLEKWEGDASTRHPPIDARGQVYQRKAHKYRNEPILTCP